MTENAPQRITALPMDTLDRTAARFRLQPNDYAVATELTMPRKDWEDLGMPSVLYLRLSAAPPPFPPDLDADPLGTETGGEL